MPPTFPPSPECATDCPCRLVPQFVENPCACGLYARGSGCPYCEVRSSGTTKEVLDSAREQSKAERLAEYDAAMATALANVAPVNPKRKKRPVSRRTSAQVTRAAEQEERERAYRDAQVTRGTVLEGNEDELAAFAAALNAEPL